MRAVVLKCWQTRHWLIAFFTTLLLCMIRKACCRAMSFWLLSACICFAWTSWISKSTSLFWWERITGFLVSSGKLDLWIIPLILISLSHRLELERDCLVCSSFGNTSELHRYVSFSWKFSLFVFLIHRTLASFNSSADSTSVFLSLRAHLKFRKSLRTSAVTPKQISDGRKLF